MRGSRSRSMAVAAKHAQGRIVSSLEGGYELHALGRSVAAHLKVLGGILAGAGVSRAAPPQ